MAAHTGDSREGARLGAERVVVVHEQRRIRRVPAGTWRHGAHYGCNAQHKAHPQPTLKHHTQKRNLIKESKIC